MFLKMMFLIFWVLMMFEDERGLGFDDVLEDDVLDFLGS